MRHVARRSRSGLFAVLSGWVTGEVSGQQFRWPARQVTAVAVSEPLTGEFSRIAGGALYPDGSVILADASEKTVTLFAPDGTVRWRVGRDGGGPGEYRAMGRVVRCENGQIAVSDLPADRITFLDPETGRVVYTRRNGLRAELVSCADSSRFLGYRFTGGNEPPPATPSYRDLPWGLITMVDTLTVALGVTRMFWTGAAWMLPSLEERAEFAGGGKVAYLCQTGSGRCQVYDRRTGTTSAFTIALPTKSVTEADWEHVRARILERVPSTFRAGLAKEFDRIPPTKTFGRFAMVRADRSGRLWVKTYQRYRQASDLWLVVSHTGTAIATVITPSGFAPLAFEGSEILGETLDEDGVPVLRRYRARLK